MNPPLVGLANELPFGVSFPRPLSFDNYVYVFTGKVLDSADHKRLIDDALADLDFSILEKQS